MLTPSINPEALYVQLGRLVEAMPNLLEPLPFPPNTTVDTCETLLEGHKGGNGVGFSRSPVDKLAPY